MPDQLFELTSQPGVRRDGTALDSPFYNDGVWVRWQRGKPRKMGGYRTITDLANGPIRSLLVDSRNASNTIHSFSEWGVQRIQFSSQGAAGSLEDRTPLPYVPNPKNTWSHAVMSSSTGGSYSALLAASTPDADQIDSDVPGSVWTGDMASIEPLTQMSDVNGPLQISGGVCVLQPFPFIYGSNGLIRNGNPNDLSPASWTVSGSSLANQANVAGTKVIHGAPVRGGGQSPAGLFWALDALIRVSFVGGTTIFNYDTISSPTSILSKKGVVEHDGRFFWPGTDRFLMYNGVVQEVPNQMNSNWFFENLNYAQRNKVWGTKISRFGEIWWFYPKGVSDECDNAVIFNYLENTWYDAKKERAAGGQVTLFPYPIWAGSEDRMRTRVLTVGARYTTNGLGTASGANTLDFASTAGVANGMSVSGPNVVPGTTVTSFTATTVVMSNPASAAIPPGSGITISSVIIPFLPGDMVTGAISGATGIVRRATLLTLSVDNVTGAFNNTENLTGPHSAAAKSRATPYNQFLDSIYQQEYGKNKIKGSDETAIEASFTSKDFGFAVGQPIAPAPITNSVSTVITRIEPDFAQVGPLTMTIQGKSYANRPSTDLVTMMIEEGAPFEDIRDAQERILRIKITTNSLNGDFDQGKVILSLAPGDERSGETT